MLYGRLGIKLLYKHILFIKSSPVSVNMLFTFLVRTMV